jgi:ferredoxin
MEDNTSGGPLRIVVDRDRCIGSGACVAVSTELFDQDDGFLVVLLQEHPTPEQLQDAEAAVDACPATAISLA